MDKTNSRQFYPQFWFPIILLFCALGTVQCSSLPSVAPTTLPQIEPTAEATLPAPESSESDPPQTPTILYFRADATDAKPGSTVTLEWASSGADTAIIQRILPSGQLAPTWIDVSPSGTLSYPIPTDDVTTSTLNLYVSQSGQQGTTAAATLRIELSCQTDWFFDPAPATCPGALRSSNAAEQRFEHGTMLWVEEFYWSDSPTANNRTIYIFFDNDPAVDGTENYFRTFTDDWTDADPASDPNLVAPNGFYQPMRGFGKIWRDNPDIQARLGWATGEENRFITMMQADTAYQYPHLYLQVSDGSVRNLWPVNYSWQPLQ